MSDNNDLIIIKKVLAGNTAAYSILVNTYKNLALTLAYNIILNREDAEEIVQDAFVKAYTSLHSFKGKAKFSTWVYKIVLNTSLNKRKLKKLNIVPVKEDSEDMPVNINSALDSYANTEQRKFIQEAMIALNENERICMTAFYLNELSIEEIKELTGITIANIKVLLYRGRKTLYSKLKLLLKEEIRNLI